MSNPSIDIVIPVRNNQDHIFDCLKKILSQNDTQFRKMTVIVVDDASTDNTVEIVKNEFGGRVHLIELTENRGRAEARNIGARHGKGDIIAFLDSDCVLASDCALTLHVAKIIDGFNVSFGKVIVRGNGFWDRYMQKVMTARERKARAGDFTVFVSANFAIKRSIFWEHDGFDTRYRHYGFEDRDLFARLVKSGVSMTYTPESSVIHHNPDFSLITLANKVKESGAYTAPLFAKDHPEIYKKMSYSKFDVRAKPYLRLAVLLFRPFFPMLVSFSTCMIRFRVAPDLMKFLMVKTVTAGAFMVGTAETSTM